MDKSEHPSRPLEAVTVDTGAGAAVLYFGEPESCFLSFHMMDRGEDLMTSLYTQSPNPNLSTLASRWEGQENKRGALEQALPQS